MLGAPRRRVDEPDSELSLGLSWLVKLRWGAVGGQVLALGVARLVLAEDLPYGPLAGLVAFTAVSNAALSHWGRPGKTSWHLPAVLVLDVVILATMLAAAGGASNPFTVFFLVHVALAALLLEARRVWAVVALTIGAFAALFWVPSPQGGHHQHHVHPGDQGSMSAHLVGMWIAYVLSAVFVAYSVGRVSRAIRDRDRRLAQAASLAAQNERLATLSSFSANAAHELGTPLATIGLAAKELSIALRRGAEPHELLPDADLVCREVTRCRDILTDLSARAGESVGEMPIATTSARIVEGLIAGLSPTLAAHLEVSYADDQSREVSLVTPVGTLTQVLHNLLRNAFEAQEDANARGAIELHIAAREAVSFHVRDRGTGIADDVRAKLGEPFVTTKGERGGLGLGVYLARAYAERVGGSLRFHRRKGAGTDVELRLPRDVLRGVS